jgi:hypothetical protein
MLHINWKITRCAFCFYFLFGRQESTAQILFGPNVGLNWTTFSIDNLAGTTSTPLLCNSLGAIAEFPLNDILSIRVEPSYIQKGSQWKNLPSGSPLPLETEIRFQYLQIPVELKASLPTPIVSPHILIGPNVSYLLSAKEGPTLSTQEDVKDFYRDFVYTLDFGTGLDYSIAPLIKGHFDLKYSIGLMNIEKKDKGDVHMHGVQIFVAVLFSV